MVQDETETVRERGGTANDLLQIPLAGVGVGFLEVFLRAAHIGFN